MNYSLLPPEVNSLRMFGGAGSGPMLAAAARDGLGAELVSAAASFESALSASGGDGVSGAGVGQTGFYNSGTGNVGAYNTGTGEVGLNF